MTALATFDRFWNGSEPGWVVCRHVQNLVSTSVEFGPNGPSVAEVQALRKCLSQYRDKPATEVLGALRGVASLNVGEHESAEARKLCVQLQTEGLHVLQSGKQQVHDIMFNELTQRGAVIEDDQTARQVVETAIAKGAPIRHVEN